jgi:RHS repeat-associated protein
VVPLIGVIDPKLQTLSVDLDVEEKAVVGGAGRGLLPMPASGDGGQVYQINAGISGPGGNWGATNTWAKGAWNVSGNTGSFNWSWPISAPPAVAGPAPELSVSYSSGSIDSIGGATGAGQGDDFGPGWSLEGLGYVERRYNTCADTAGYNAVDLCWSGYNATMSFGGRASELIRLSPTSDEYRLKDDPGWRVMHMTGSSGPPGAAPWWNNATVGDGLHDNDGEHWVVYTPDGTAYFFGLGYEPTSLAPTNSVQAVPVRTADVAGVCATGVVCGQGYRWNLDRKLDRNGNVTTYFWNTEINWYSDPGGSGWFPYATASHPARIEYTKRVLAENTAAPATLYFNYTDRNTLDYPADAACNIFTNTNCKQAPTFFSTKITFQISGYTGPTPVWAQNFSYDFYTTDVSKYWLYTAQRFGYNTTTAAWDSLPPVRFDGILKSNLLGTSTVVPSINIYRVAQIQDEYGADIRVYYDQPNPCLTAAQNTGGYPLPFGTPVNLNEYNCYPMWTVAAGGDAGFRWFNKYLVTAVDVIDSTGGSPAMRTAYNYNFDIFGAERRTLGWHFNDDPFSVGHPTINGIVVPTDRRTWSQWNGYPRVTVSKGPVSYASFAAAPVPGAATTFTETRYYTGMTNDCSNATSSPCAIFRGVVPVRYADGNLGPWGSDLEFLVGRPYQIRNTPALVSAAGTEVSGSAITYTWAQNASNGVRTSRLVVPQTQQDYTWRASTASWELKYTTTNYIQSTGIPTDVTESGTGVATRCTTYNYLGEYVWQPGTYIWLAAGNVQVQTWIADRVQYTVLHDASCTGTALARTDFAYNTAGDTLNIYRFTNIAAWQYVYSTYAYDPYGRVTSIIDPLLRTTTTAYSPATGFPTTVTTTPPAPGLVTTATLDPRYGVVTKAQDNALPTNAVTEARYDAFGRRTEVTYPGTASGTYDVMYKYYTQGNASIVDTPVAAGLPQPKMRSLPIVVKTSARQAGNGAAPATPATWIDSYTYLDGLMRTRETQTVSPVSGRVVAATIYDGNGRAYESTAPFNSALGAGSGLTYVGPGGAPRSTRTSFDAFGRPTSSATLVYGAQQYATTYAYDGLSTTEQPPAPAASTKRTNDVYGRLISVLENGINATTANVYNGRNDLLTTTDAASNVTTNTYDDLSRKLTNSDPDQGLWVFGYDNASRLNSRQDAKGQTITFQYDNIDRKISEKSGTTTLASWGYDVSRTGQLYYSCTLTCTDPNTVAMSINSYNVRGQPLAVYKSVPGSYGFGSPDAGGRSLFLTSYTYDAASGAQRSVTYPSLNGAPPETVTTGLTSLGLPNQLSATSAYISSTGYNAIGQLSTMVRASGTNPITTTNGYDGLQRLSSVQSSTQSGTTFQNDIYGYDNNNNISSIQDATAGAAQFQCFGYDVRNRLQSSYTTTNAACGTATTAGPSPYNLTFAYSPIGNMTSYTGTGTTTAAPGGYSYGTAATSCNGASVTKPHAVTATSGNAGSYGYDCNGSMTARNMNGTNQTLTYDSTYGRLQSVAVGGQSTGFIYDADGQRIIRNNPDGTRNLYLGDVELKTSLGSTTGPVPVHRASLPADNGAAGAASITITKPTTAVAGDVLVASVAAASTTSAGGTGATPVHRETTAAANGTGGTTITLTKPATAVAGDVLVASVAAADVTGGGATTYSDTFETSTANWSVWTGTGTISATTTQFHLGAKSLQMTAGGGWASAQVFPPATAYTAGAPITVTMWVKGTGTLEPFFTAFNSAFTQLNQTAMPTVAMTGGWQQWTGTYSVPAGTANLGISFRQSATTNWYLDDFVMSTGGAGGTTATTATAPAGWTAVTTNTVAGVGLTTWRHAVVAGDPASWVFNLSQSARATGSISAYSGVDLTTPIDASGTAGTTPTAGTSHTAPAVTTTGTNRLVMSVNAVTGVTSLTPPAGSTERADQAAAVTAPTATVEVSEFTQAAAGTTASRISTSAAAGLSATATIALRPIPAGGTTVATTTTAPAGWTAITTNTVTGVGLTTWRHTVAAGDPTSWSFGLSQVARAAGAVSAYSGVDPANPIDVSATGTNATATLSHLAPSVTTTGANRLGFSVNATTAATSMTPPSGSTERTDQAGGVTVPTATIETSEFPQTTAGATGAKTTVSLAAALSATATITLRPPTTGGAGPITYSSYYHHAGQTIGYRQSVAAATAGAGVTVGAVQWMFGNHQASASITVADNTTIAVKNRYLPYGGLRGADSLTSTDHGFLDQTEDNTGLDYLNNRYHDPTLGRFISVDSLVSVTGSAYGYGNNNPTTYSDPTGLCVDECGGEGDRVVRQKQRDAVDSSTNEWLAKCSNAWSQCKDGDTQGRFGDIQNRARRRAVSVIDGLLGAGSVSHNERHDVICFGSDSGSCQSWGLPAIYNAATFTFDQAVLNHDSGNLAVSLRAMGVLVGGNSAIKALSALAGKSQVDMHHLFPQQFRAQFQQMGIDIENYKIPIPSGYHQSLHGADSSAFEGRWNSAWSNWFASNEAATADMALEQMMTMAEEAGLWDLPPVTPPGMYDRNGK